MNYEDRLRATNEKFEQLRMEREARSDAMHRDFALQQQEMVDKQAKEAAKIDRVSALIHGIGVKEREAGGWGTSSNLDDNVEEHAYNAEEEEEDLDEVPGVTEELQRYREDLSERQAWGAVDTQSAPGSLAEALRVHYLTTGELTLESASPAVIGDVDDEYATADSPDRYSGFDEEDEKPQRRFAPAPPTRTPAPRAVRRPVDDDEDENTPW
ncbi:hypothetical protein [Umezawaea beigongshangensis]|uniref:hypothetical protein n=1 Tax=Umezawaea beigongshangensis TaxID=2780383 RepID=UPI0018F14269|nr:hypothetical protein [Umezawaea beigongshangensis]